MSVSFGFKKKIESKVVTSDKPKGEGPDYLKSVESNVLQSTKKKEDAPSELVIPLIRRNRYRLPPNKKVEGEKNFPVDELEAKAARELVEESKGLLENENQNDEEFNDLKIPLLLKNKVPEGYETDDRLDVSLRPNEATEAQYDQVSVAAFGMAVLRGMGWTPEVGIGKTFKQNTKVLEQKVRPKGLGLGAETPAALKTSTNGSKSSKVGEASIEEDSLALTKDACVLVTSGTLKDKYAIVIGLDTDTARCVLKMAIGGKTERVGLHRLRVISKKEYSKNAKDLSRLSKAYTGQSISIIGNGKDENEVSTKPPKELSKKRREAVTSSEPKDKSRKKDEEDRSPERQESSKHKKHKKHNKTRKHSPSPHSHKMTWVRRQMRVRIVDKSYKKGRYYREKVIVEDVLGRGICCCKTDDGKLLDDIQDSMLETVIPKSSSDAYVIIAQGRKGKHNGKLARILEKDKKMCEALLQLIEDRDTVVRVGFEDMCEFAGDPEMNAMF